MPGDRTGVLGYPRRDGRVGIRDVAVVVYLVECARQVAEAIATGPRRASHRLRRLLPERLRAARCWNGCAPIRTSVPWPWCRWAARASTATRLADVVAASGRPVTTLVIQQPRRHPRDGGRRAGMDRGGALTQSPQRARRRWRCPTWSSAPSAAARTARAASPPTPPSAACSTALIDGRRHGIFEETGELIGCEHHMASARVTPELGGEIVACVAKAARLLHGARPRQLRARQRRRWPHHAWRKSRSAPTPSAGAPIARRRHTRATSRRPAASTCSTSSPTATCAGASPTSTTTPRSPS